MIANQMMYLLSPVSGQFTANFTASLDPRRPVWVLIASIFLPFLRGLLAAYICVVSSRSAEWGRLLHMLPRHLQSLTLAVLCALGAVTGWGGV